MGGLKKARDMLLAGIGLLLLVTALAGCKGEKKYPMEVELSYEREGRSYGWAHLEIQTPGKAHVWVTAGDRRQRDLGDPEDGHYVEQFGVDEHEEVFEVEIKVVGSYEGERYEVTETYSMELPTRLHRGDEGLHCSHGHECAIEWRDYTTLVVSAEVGTVLEVAGQQWTVESSPQEIPAAADVMLAEVSMDELLEISGGGYYDLLVSLTFPSGDVASGQLNLSAMQQKSAVATLFNEVVNGPVALTNEGTGHAILVYPPELTSRMIHLEEIQSLGDVHYVALVEQVNVGERGCGSYQNSAGEWGSAIVQVYDHIVKLYDRRSGELMAENTFNAPSSGGCPTSFNSAVGRGGGAVKPSASEEYAWMREQIAGR